MISCYGVYLFDIYKHNSSITYYGNCYKSFIATSFNTNIEDYRQSTRSILLVLIEQGCGTYTEYRYKFMTEYGWEFSWQRARNLRKEAFIELTLSSDRVYSSPDMRKSIKEPSKQTFKKLKKGFLVSQITTIRGTHNFSTMRDFHHVFLVLWKIAIGLHNVDLSDIERVSGAKLNIAIWATFEKI